MHYGSCGVHCRLICSRDDRKEIVVDSAAIEDVEDGKAMTRYFAVHC